MIRHRLHTFLAGLVALAGASAGVSAQERTPALSIVAPENGAYVSGHTRLEAHVTPPSELVSRVRLYADGRLVCETERAPHVCMWEAGPSVREHHIRAVATLSSGERLVANVRTAAIGYADRTRVDAVQVPVIVKDNRGNFVRGLEREDFILYEDGRPQPISAMVASDAPLDVVVAIDISDSMKGDMSQVKGAVKQFLGALRPSDAASVLGFNDTIFTVARRETSADRRGRAVDRLAPWGGTALYDATLKSLALIAPQIGRKGVVVFSDGEDQDSRADRDQAVRGVQASEAMLYTIAQGRGASVPTLRKNLESFARLSGGRSFFTKDGSHLVQAFAEIIEELSNQYMLSYVPAAPRDGRWHELKVEIRGRRYRVRAREGYRLDDAAARGGA